MNKFTSILAGIGIGAGFMYYLDPERGNRRRALVKDRFMSAKRQADDAIDGTVRDLRNRSKGLLAETAARLSNEEIPDWVLEERVRAEMGRSVRHSGAIEVHARDGNIVLQGPILSDEVERMIRNVARVRSVKSVENQLDVHQEPGNIPELQGNSQKKIKKAEWEQEFWSPSMRLLSSSAGGILTLYGLTRRGAAGTVLSVLGLGLAARGVTNIDLGNIVGLKKERNALRFHKTININAPVEELYQFWLQLENIPRFMTHVKEVKDLGNNRSRWTVEGPAGVNVGWDAVITEKVPNELVAWESIQGEEIETAGKVRFRANPDGSTRMTIHLEYTPPVGVLGHVVASVFGKDPKRAMDEDLLRLKTQLESSGDSHA
ncbi:MAG: SRPBCC family protein [Anaerolineales bacterium]